MVMSGGYGAGKQDWLHFSEWLGLTEDLLPVVSNPSAKISERSTMKKLGKTPSLYNRSGEAVGIAKWTEKRSSEWDIEKWSRVSDYGICVQTRRVRAIDIDVEKSAGVLNLINNALGAVPVRQRANSGKCLVGFIVEGDIYKRVLPVRDGIIELLGNGQQFIASGEHTSGVRYRWDWCGLDGFPVVGVELLNELWAALEWEFGTGPTQYASARRERNSHVEDVEDPILQILDVLSWGRDGEAYIKCPWKSEHTDHEEEAGSSTAYFPAGSGGYEQGHFKCLHAHCNGRSDWDFKLALGVVSSGFDVIEDAVEDAGVEDAVGGGGGIVENPLDKSLDCNDDGKILATVGNLQRILSRPHLCKQDIRYDTFRDEIVYKPVGGSGWVPFKDTDYTRLRLELGDTGFLPVGREIIKDVVHFVASLRRFDTAIEWINGLPEWDGIKRIERFLPDYMGSNDTAYERAVSEYAWCAMAGRVLEPGCKADAAIILAGEQYIGKSFAAESMCPDLRWFGEIKLDDKEDDLARKMKGKLIAEFAELKGLWTKDLESIKAFITRRYEEWVPKYMEFATVYPRRLIFWGTTNDDEIFNDDTGERRWFPVKVCRADIERIIWDRDQLWAEGAAMFRAVGIKAYYDKANDLAGDTRREFAVTDIWEEPISDWLFEADMDGQKNANCEFLRVSDVMRGALNLDTKNMKGFEAKRVGKILKKFGYKKVAKWIDNKTTKVWSKV